MRVWKKTKKKHHRQNLIQIRSKGSFSCRSDSSQIGARVEMIDGLTNLVRDIAHSADENVIFWWVWSEGTSSDVMRGKGFAVSIAGFDRGAHPIGDFVSKKLWCMLVFRFGCQRCVDTIYYWVNELDLSISRSISCAIFMSRCQFDADTHHNKTTSHRSWSLCIHFHQEIITILLVYI